MLVLWLPQAQERWCRHPAEPHHWCLYYFIYLYHSIFLSIAQKRPKWRKKSQELTVQKTLANLLKQPDHLNSARDEKNWSIFCSWFISSPWASNFMVHEVAKQLFWKTWKRLNAKKSVPRSCRCCLSGARCFCSTRHLVDATVSQLTFYFYLKIRPAQLIRGGGGSTALVVNWAHLSLGTCRSENVFGVSALKIQWEQHNGKIKFRKKYTRAN